MISIKSLIKQIDTIISTNHTDIKDQLLLKMCHYLDCLNLTLPVAFSIAININNEPDLAHKTLLFCLTDSKVGRQILHTHPPLLEAIESIDHVKAFNHRVGNKTAASNLVSEKDEISKLVHKAKLRNLLPLNMQDLAVHMYNKTAASPFKARINDHYIRSIYYALKLIEREYQGNPEEFAGKDEQIFWSKILAKIFMQIKQLPSLAAMNKKQLLGHAFTVDGIENISIFMCLAAIDYGRDLIRMDTPSFIEACTPELLAMQTRGGAKPGRSIHSVLLHDEQDIGTCLALMVKAKYLMVYVTPATLNRRLTHGIFTGLTLAQAFIILEPIATDELFSRKGLDLNKLTVSAYCEYKRLSSLEKSLSTNARRNHINMHRQADFISRKSNDKNNPNIYDIIDYFENLTQKMVVREELAMKTALNVPLFMHTLYLTELEDKSLKEIINFNPTSGNLLIASTLLFIASLHPPLLQYFTAIPGLYKLIDNKSLNATIITLDGDKASLLAQIARYHQPWFSEDDFIDKIDKETLNSMHVTRDPTRSTLYNLSATTLGRFFVNRSRKLVNLIDPRVFSRQYNSNYQDINQKVIVCIYRQFMNDSEGLSLFTKYPEFKKSLSQDAQLAIDKKMNPVTNTPTRRTAPVSKPKQTKRSHSWRENHLFSTADKPSNDVDATQTTNTSNNQLAKNKMHHDDAIKTVILDDAERANWAKCLKACFSIKGAETDASNIPFTVTLPPLTEAWQFESSAQSYFLQVITEDTLNKRILSRLRKDNSATVTITAHSPNLLITIKPLDVMAPNVKELQDSIFQQIISEYSPVVHQKRVVQKPLVALLPTPVKPTLPAKTQIKTSPANTMMKPGLKIAQLFADIANPAIDSNFHFVLDKIMIVGKLAQLTIDDKARTAIGQFSTQAFFVQMSHLINEKVSYCMEVCKQQDKLILKIYLPSLLKLESLEIRKEMNAAFNNPIYNESDVMNVNAINLAKPAGEIFCGSQERNENGVYDKHSYLLAVLKVLDCFADSLDQADSNWRDKIYDASYQWDHTKFYDYLQPLMLDLKTTLRNSARHDLFKVNFNENKNKLGHIAVTAIKKLGVELVRGFEEYDMSKSRLSRIK